MPSIKTYRFLEPCHAEEFLNKGLVKIGSAASFAALEDAQCDRMDSAVQHNYSVTISSRNDPRLKAMQDAGFLAIKGSGSIGTIHFNAVSLNHRIHGHALCFSQNPASTAFRAGGKTAVIEIFDTEGFGAALTDAGEGQLGPQMRGAPVRYEPRKFANAQTFTAPSPFIKDKSYEAEQEYRLFWPSAGPCEAVFVTAPESVRFARRIA